MRPDIRGNRVRLRHVKTVVKPSGLVFHYLMVPGCPSVRLPDLPKDHPDFLAAYAAARQQAVPARVPSRYGTGTIGAAIIAYEASDRFLALGNATLARRRTILSQITGKAGAAMLRDLQPRHIEADLAGLTPHPANGRLKAWRGLCAWAREAGLVPSDAAAQVRPRRIPKSDGHLPWSKNEVEAFRAHWPLGSMQRLALELLHWTAARVSDAVRLGPGMIDRAGWLVFRQNKTGGEVAVPIARSLPSFAAGMQADLEHLQAALDARRERHMTFLTTQAGSARSVKAMGMWFSTAARTAGVVKTAHGLRKTRATALAEAGATEHQIAAWTGHESLTEVRRYTRKADKRRILSGDSEQGGNEKWKPDVPGFQYSE